MAKNYPNYPWMSMDFAGSDWTNGYEKTLVSKGLLYFAGLCWISIWWRRGESNPLPRWKSNEINAFVKQRPS